MLTGWFADYPDPVDFINILLDGANIPSQNNVNLALMDVPKFNDRMRQAARLTGRRGTRLSASSTWTSCGTSPWARCTTAPSASSSHRVGCYVYQPSGRMDLAAACLE